MNAAKSRRIPQWLVRDMTPLLGMIILAGLGIGAISLFHLDPWHYIVVTFWISPAREWSGFHLDTRDYIAAPFGILDELEMLKDIFLDFLSRLLIKVRFQSILAELSVWGLTGIAAVLAGRKRLTLREEWAAHLAGESGHDPANRQKVKQALGFVVSAIRYRCSDVADAAWTPVDAVLKSRTLSNLFVIIPTTMAAYIVLYSEGTLGMVKAAESIIEIGGMLYGLVRLGRWWRDVKPQNPKARRTKK